ncbi:MAG: ATPase, T2SS/T4P/T4SS family [Pseudomonadota bacterium]|nr:ATPase, T2SS/T4P/T4SS family [Pseudomonadota bacterium]
MATAKPDYQQQPTPAQENRTHLGLLLVDEGLITAEQLREALQLQQDNPRHKDDHQYLGEILVNKNYIRADQLRSTMKKHNKKSRLGDILLRCKAITEQELEFALIEQKKNGHRLGEILLKKSLISDETLRQALCTHLNIPFIDISRFDIDQNLSKIINRDYAYRHKVIPISTTEDSITLAMDDPTNTEIITELEMFTRLKINLVTSSRVAIQDAFQRLYPLKNAQKKPLKSVLSSENSAIDFTFDLEDSEQTEIRKPQYVEAQESKRADVLVQRILSWAIQQNASDIHLENLDRRMVIRFRIDGLLQEFNLGELQDDINNFHREIISRIKILCKLDIAEKRLAQDGSFRSHILRHGEKSNIDFRISIIPSYYGENIVIRILDSRQAPTTIENLNFSPKLTNKLINLFRRNTGIILVTGPTGSGKSTTLQSGLLSAYRPGLKILTAEDPIEYVYDHFMQCEVNEKIGLTFASYIRVFLRHDPEIIMIGEIRDDETAEMAVRAAQTGHLVISTLHTNDSLGAITRLTGLGVEPNMITSSLIGVISQRLARRTCPHCKEAYSPPKELINEFFASPPTDIKWVKGHGCQQCNFTRFKGRLAIAELWEPNQNDILLINKKAPHDKLKVSARKSTIPIMEEAISKLKSGDTTLEELIRSLPYSFIEDYRQHGPRS